MAHALRPSHAALDGDLIFAASTERNPRPPAPRELAEISMLAADTLAPPSLAQSMRRRR